MNASLIAIAELPLSLRTLPLCVTYEITRVFLHAGVSLKEVEFSPSPFLTDYDTLWRFLKALPNLQGKPFPERCSLETWEAALGDFHHGTRAVYMNGSLRFNLVVEARPLFRLQLGALRLDSSHRAGRCFGHDRFLEIDMPSLTGDHVPRCLQLVRKRGSEVIIEWLVDQSHRLLDRLWKPFHLKPKERKERKADTSQKPTADPEPVHRVFFFAVDGNDFIEGGMRADASKPYVKLTIAMLLNCIRPTRKNVKQSFLKLFSRTSLGERHPPPTA